MLDLDLIAPAVAPSHSCRCPFVSIHCSSLGRDHFMRLLFSVLVQIIRDLTHLEAVQATALKLALFQISCEFLVSLCPPPDRCPVWHVRVLDDHGMRLTFCDPAQKLLLDLGFVKAWHFLPAQKKRRSRRSCSLFHKQYQKRPRFASMLIYACTILLPVIVCAYMLQQGSKA